MAPTSDPGISPRKIWPPEYRMFVAVKLNDGTGNFGAFLFIPGSGSDDNEADFLDFDNGGDLDVYVANWSGADKLYANDGSGGMTLTSDLPVVARREALGRNWWTGDVTVQMLETLAIPGLDPHARVQGEAVRCRTQLTAIGFGRVSLTIRAAFGAQSARAVSLDGRDA